MTLIINDDKFKLDFTTEHPEPYVLSGNRIFIISENWDYIIRDGLSKKTIFSGKFDEEPSKSTINSIYSYWFYEISPSRILHYSPTHNEFRIYNFETKEVERSVKNHFQIKAEFEFFSFVEYAEETKTIYLVHMKEFTKCAIESCSIDDSANVTTITEFELSNPNCIYYDKKMLYFGTQTQETSPFVMHFLKNGTYFRVDFAYAENIQFLDAGFYQTNVMYLLYNHNEKAEGGLFLITKNFDEKVPLLSIDAKDESVQKLILSKEEDPEILDGRIIVDKLLNSITITGMDSIRRYHVRLENEKYIPEFLTKKNVEDPIDYIPLNRESLTSWAFDEETTEARIGFYKATDTRCLYHWLFQQSKLGDHFNIGDLEDLCNLLV